MSSLHATVRLARCSLVIGVLAAAGGVAGAACPPENGSGGAAAQVCTHPEAGCAAHDHGPVEMLLRASDELAPEGETPEQAACRREEVFEKFRTSALCFSKDSTPEQMARIIGLYDMLPPGLVMANGDRFRIDNTVWAGNSGFGASGRAVRTTLRYSFPADGIAWGGTASVNNLNATITARFTAANSDRGRELIRQSLAAWRRVCALTYNEVSDSGAAFSNSTSAVGVGDVRIGSIPQDGVFGVLAYNFFPTGGSDMTIDSNDFTTNSLWSTANNFRFLRNVVSHEHGHGLGFIHTVPCDNTKLMEPQASSAFDTLQIDEIRGGQRNYGDRFNGNTSAATATDFGNLTTPVLKSIVQRNLSTNGTGGFSGSSADWFKFTLGSAQNVVITVVPTGGSYVEGQQSNGCTGTTSTVVASQAGNLNVELRDSAGATTVLAADAAGGAGITETITANGLAAGTYTVRVIDVGPNANQTLQLYDMTIRVGTAKAPPQPIAGLNKRVAAGQVCFFMGDINSRVNDTGATLNNASYDWDLDGDGVFETLDNPQPSRVYPSNGNFNATLRLTDSNGMQATDTIVVSVLGAASVLSSIAPTSGSLGSTIPITITGVSLGGVTSTSQVTLSGTGVTVTGTPVVTTNGTTITGLSFVIGGAAAAGPRNLTITNADGAGQTVSLNSAFTVTTLPPTNDDCSTPIGWGSLVGPRPFSNNSATTGTVQSFPNSGCPTAGPINNDVWYTWTAPVTGSLGVVTDSGTSIPAFSSRVAVYQGTGCPSGSTNLRGCDDFGFQFNIAVVQGQTYLFQVGSVFAGTTGTANVVLTLAAFQGACCDSSGFCNVELLSNCTGTSTYQGTGTVCNPSPCPEVEGTCCAADGTCTFVFHSECVGVWTPGGSCSRSPCDQPTGACCAADGGCAQTEQAACTGTWTAGAACDPSPCAPVSGACCTGTTCSTGTAALCQAALGQFQGAATACGPAGNPTMCCIANFNGQDGVTIQDIFDFLTAFFSSTASADVNHADGVTVQDVFDYLSAYFAGCS